MRTRLEAPADSTGLPRLAVEPIVIELELVYFVCLLRSAAREVEAQLAPVARRHCLASDRSLVDFFPPLVPMMLLLLLLPPEPLMSFCSN